MKRLRIVLILAITALSLTGCIKYQFQIKSTVSHEFNLNDTITIQAGQTMVNQPENFTITFDSLKNESRCPLGMECFWAGYASAVFHYTKNYHPVYFTLYTLSTMGNDTTIDQYNIKLIDLSPYPVANKTINPDDYVAKLLIRKN